MQIGSPLRSGTRRSVAVNLSTGVWQMISFFRSLWRDESLQVAELNPCCSFCQKHYRKVGPLIEGPGHVYICGECIEVCQSVLDQERIRHTEHQLDAERSPES